MPIKLNSSYSLSSEPHLKGVRLIVLDNGNEWVCRKESFKKLNSFLSLDGGRIFKGRLQLYKHQNAIAVEVKGNNMGEICVTQLKKLLQ